MARDRRRVQRAAARITADQGDAADLQPPQRRAPAPGLAALAGYAQHRPNLGNFEGQCPSVLFNGYPADPIAAVDALRPDQQALLADYVAGQPPEGEGERGALAA